MTAEAPPVPDDLDIKTYREFRRVVRGHSAQSLRTLYDRGYFERQVADRELADLYFQTLGLAPTRYTEPPIKLASLRPGDRVLDVGCGRGEVVFQSAARGAVATGIDFATSAIEIASATRGRHAPEIRDRVRFVEGNAESLPFDSGSFEKVFMLDVVEHLSPGELRRVLGEIRRVLVPGGMLIIHTTENRWNNTLGHRLHRVVSALRRRPPQPPPAVAEYQRVRADPELDERKWFMHVNEQSVPGLKLALWRAGFSSRVWIGNRRNGWQGKPGLGNRAKHAIYTAARLHLLYGNQIYAIAVPRGHGASLTRRSRASRASPA